MSETISLVSERKSDAEVAAEIKKKMTDALNRVREVMDEAHAAGLKVNFQLGADYTGRAVIAGLDVMKVQVF